eukprot:349407_1
MSNKLSSQTTTVSLSEGTSVDKNWIVFQSVPGNVTYESAISLNDDEFIIGSQLLKDDNYLGLPQIYKYNTRTNEWKVFIKYPFESPMKIHQLAYDRDKKELYLLNSPNVMSMVTTETKQWNIEYGGYIDVKFQHRVAKFYDPSGFINTNGTIHSISGQNHCVWNNAKNSFERIYNFRDKIRILSVVYVSSKKILLLICGAESWQKITNIYKYCIISHNWTKLNEIKINISQWGCNAVLTSDENFIIFNERWKNDKIWVLDIIDANDCKLRESSICCPKPGGILIRMQNKLLDESTVIGYVKKLFKTKEFNNLQLPPACILELISEYYNQEMIHWIDTNIPSKRSKYNHFGINVKQILLSCNISAENISTDCNSFRSHKWLPPLVHGQSTAPLFQLALPKFAPVPSNYKCIVCGSVGDHWIMQCWIKH